MPELRKVEPVKEKSEGRVKIKADKIEIEVESNTKGTMFCLVIAEKILKGSETIFFIDDEDSVLDIGKELLERIGYNVLIFRNGRAAIERISRAKDSQVAPDLVILDMIMPDMGGGEAFDRLREIDPDIKVLLASGYSVDGQATEILRRGCNGFIQKPFSITELSKKLRELLD